MSKSGDALHQRCGRHDGRCPGAIAVRTQSAWARYHRGSRIGENRRAWRKIL